MRYYSKKLRIQKMSYTQDVLQNKNNLPISFGEFTYGQPQLRADYWPCGVHVGKFCSIGPNVQFLIDVEHRSDWVTTYPFPVLKDFPEAHGVTGHPYAKGNILVGNDVWIGLDAVIFSGVTIGDGAVIGARAVVTHDVPPYAIVAGNPARVIRNRFSEDTVKRLLVIRWWNWPVEKIKKYIPLLCSRNIDEFILAVQEDEYSKGDSL